MVVNQEATILLCLYGCLFRFFYAINSSANDLHLCSLFLAMLSINLMTSCQYSSKLLFFPEYSDLFRIMKTNMVTL